MVVGDIVTSTDVFILGAGPGGYVAALRAAELGLDVTLVESARAGGVCLQQGCIPSKAFIQAADEYHRALRLGEIGLPLTAPAPADLGGLVAWKDGVVGALTQGVEQLLRARDVHVVHGPGEFMSAQSAAVDTSEGRQAFHFRFGVIATGSRARPLPELPADGTRILMPRHLLSLRELPEHLLVIGGGYIGIELGVALRKLGAQVTVVEAGSGILPGFDADLSEVAARRLGELGIPVRLGVRPVSAEERDGKLHVRLDTGSSEETVQASHVLVAVGRDPQSSGLGLEALGLLGDDGAVHVDSQLRTSVAGIFAVGDVTGGPMLAHRASHQGIVAAEVMAGRSAAFDPAAIPAVVYGDPELAWAGLTVEEAGQQGYAVQTARFPMRALGRALAGRMPEGLTKLVFDGATGVVLGGGVAGGHASDLIGELALALEMGATLEDIAATVHAHPTFSEGWQEAALLGLGSPIHTGARIPRAE